MGLVQKILPRKRSTNEEVELVLHVGTHKTGTTFIQKTLRNNRRKLLRSGVSYLDWGYQLGKKLKSLTEHPGVTEVEFLRSELRQSVSATLSRTVILSGEGMSGDPFKCYSNSALVASSLRRITREFPTKIVVVFREQDAFYESLYHQHVKEGGALELADFMSAVDPLQFSWLELIDAFGDAFGKENVIAHSYESLFRNSQSVLNVLFSCVDCFDCPAKSDQRVNTSYNELGLQLALRCNPLLNDSQQKDLRAFLAAKFPRDVNDPSLLPEELIESLRERYSSENREVFQKYGLRRN